MYKYVRIALLSRNWDSSSMRADTAGTSEDEEGGNGCPSTTTVSRSCMNVKMSLGPLRRSPEPEASRARSLTNAPTVRDAAKALDRAEIAMDGWENERLSAGVAGA